MGHRDTLREATRSAHMSAEAAWIGDSGFSGRLGYMGWLQALQAAHVGLGQPAAARIGQDFLTEAERQRVSALTADIGGCTPEPAPRMRESYAWGALYALNGSALGASMLLKSGTIPPHWPQAYVTQMRDFATSGQVAAFFQALDAAPLDPSAALAGAEAVFDRVRSPVLVPAQSF